MMRGVEIDAQSTILSILASNIDEELGRPHLGIRDPRYWPVLIHQRLSLDPPIALTVQHLWRISDTHTQEGCHPHNRRAALRFHQPRSSPSSFTTLPRCTHVTRSTHQGTAPSLLHIQFVRRPPDHHPPTHQGYHDRLVTNVRRYRKQFRRLCSR